MIKSSELVIGKLVRVDNVPVSQSREEKEDEHLRGLLASSHEQKEQRIEQQKLEDQMHALLEAIPHAFQFTETGTEMSSERHKLVHLKFQPAADFKPPSVELEVLHGLEGTMIVDATRKQIVKLEAHLFRDVDFGWGILVRLDRGGTLTFDRDPTDERASNIREFSLDVNGRVLLLKRVEIQWKFDHFSCFRQPIALSSAVAMLTSPRISLLISNK